MPTERTIPAPDTTDLPTFTILLEGEEISGEYQVALVAVTKGVNQVGAAKVVVFDGDPSKEDFPISNGGDFVPGKEIEIKAGYHSTEESIFKGIVIKHGLKFGKKGRSMLVLDCKDEAVKMTVGRKNAYFFESTDSDIIEEILGKYAGLTPDVEGTTVSHAEMVQYYVTDWDFMVSRAEVNEMLVFNDSGNLKVAPPDLSSDPVLTLLHGATLLEFSAEMDARTQFSAVSGTSWDFSEQELLEIEGEAPGFESSGNITSDDLTEVIGLEAFLAQHPGKVEDAELQAWTNTVMMRSRLAKIRGHAKCQGFAGVKPGDVVELQGVGDRFNGKVFVAGVRHQIDKENWVTDIEFGYDPKWFHRKYKDIIDVPGGGLVPGIQGLHIGIVVALEGDPNGEDRVQVRMPLISDAEDGVWARVSTLDAGDTRGSFFRPEIDDEVVLGFMNGDPRDPVILGMMNSSAKPAPIAASDDNHEKGFVTRSGMKFIFHDDEKSITFLTPNGNTIVLSEDSGSILIEDENGNKVEMTSGGIEMDSPGDVTIKASGDVKIEGTNVEIAANAQFTAEGSAGAEVSSSATMVVKGAVVQIN